MNSLVELNKQIVQDLYQKAYQNDSYELVCNYFHQEFKQHNPWLENGINNVAGMHMFHFRYHLVKIVAQRDLVAVHGYYQLEDSMSEMAIFGVDIWRLEEGKIVEHWDVHELLPEKNRQAILGKHTNKSFLDQDQMIFNTGLVNTFSYLAFCNKDVANLDSFISEEFIFHYKNKVLSLEELRSHLLKIPESRYEIIHMIASDDYVIIHSHWKSDHRKKAGIEIYRTNKNNQIEEMWSLTQEFIHVKKALNATSYQEN